jgi:O-methyltransferase involved in polyketide biosynthesis
VTETPSGRERPTIDASVPHSARFWNYLLGGKDNYAVDREMAEQVRLIFPQVFDIARADRAFLGRSVSYLAGEAGIRQFLDIGTGLPTLDNTHEVAQRVAPESRVVYVDNDPVVLLHAETLLTSEPPGVTGYIQADLRDPEAILSKAGEVLDFGKPVAITLLGILHFVGDDDEAYRIVGRLLDAVPSGSYLAITHATLDPSLGDEATVQANAAMNGMWNQTSPTPISPRDREHVARFFTGLELVEPGLVSMSQWRPAPSRWGVPPEVMGFGAVGRKP